MKIQRISSRKKQESIVDDVDGLEAALPPDAHLVVCEVGQETVAFVLDPSIPTEECAEALAAHHPLLDHEVEVTAETYGVEPGARGILVDIGAPGGPDDGDGVIAVTDRHRGATWLPPYGNQEEEYGAPMLPGRPPLRLYVSLCCLKAVTS